MMERKHDKYERLIARDKALAPHGGERSLQGAEQGVQTQARRSPHE
jgi:hypothetical protein